LVNEQLKRAVRAVDVHDIIGVAGFCALVHGVGQWSPAGAWMVAGLLLLGCWVWPLLVRRGKG
jgi:hypothetical protein